MVQIGLISTEQPHSALVLALAPTLAATGIQVAAAVDDFLNFDTDQRDRGGLMMVRGSGPQTADRLPGERVFWIGEPPFTRALPVGRTLGRARFHEVVGVLTGKAQGSGLETALIEVGAYLQAGLGEYDYETALHVMRGALSSGTAAERLALIFGDQALHSPSTVAPLPEHRLDVIAERRGAVSGWASAPLKAALRTLGPQGGIGRMAAPGFTTGPRKPVARLYGDSAAALEQARGQLLTALKLG